MKGKATMIVTMGAMFALLTFVMLMQFRTIESTDISALELMRETELRAELASWKTKYEEANEKLEETNTKIIEYNDRILNNQEAFELLEQELDQSNVILGKTDVIGNGVVVTLKDNEYAKITSSDIYTLVNELNLAGAEAISVNGERIMSMTDIKDIAPGYIVIGGKKITSPYVVKAIGDQTYLESALTLKDYGYMDLIMKSENKTAVLDKESDIVIEKTTKDVVFKYAEEVKEK